MAYYPSTDQPLYADDQYLKCADCGTSVDRDADAEYCNVEMAHRCGDCASAHLMTCRDCWEV